MATIQQVRGFEILDSRGNPTVACEVVLSDGARGHSFDGTSASAVSCETSVIDLLMKISQCFHSWSHLKPCPSDEIRAI